MVNHSHTSFTKYFGGSSPWWLGPLLVFAVSRLTLFAVIYVGLVLNPTPPSWVAHNYENAGHAYDAEIYKNVPTVVTGLSRWDAAWYESIWRDGYSYDVSNTRKYNVNFFPAYPLTVRAILAATGNTDNLGWHFLYAEILSNALFLAGLLLFYRLALALGETRKIALLGTLIAAFQPASVFFSAPYTESMCFFLVAATLLAAKNRHWALAGVCGMICSGTRVTGAALAPAVGLMWLANEGVTWRALVNKSDFTRAASLLIHKRSWLWILLIPCGLFAYMAYLWTDFGDALAFVHSQRQWNLIPRGFWVVIPHDMLLALTHDAPVIQINLLMFFAALAAAIAAWRRYGAGMGVFCLCCILMPATATTSSMLRYVAIALPVFMVAAHYFGKWKLCYIAIALLGIGSLYAAYVFTHVRFVA